MMGYAQRAREAADALRVERYKVRRWTAFEWTPPEEGDMREWRKEREDHLKRAAGMLAHALHVKCPDFEPSVVQVRVGRKPELLFEITVRATDEDDARRRAMYQIGRALSTKIPVGLGRKITLSPPWGKCEVEVVREHSRRRVKDAA